MLQRIKDFMRGEEGATMVEYGIMVALIAAAAVIAVKTLGGTVNTTFTDVNTKMQPAS